MPNALFILACLACESFSWQEHVNAKHLLSKLRVEGPSRPLTLTGNMINSLLVGQVNQSISRAMSKFNALEVFAMLLIGFFPTAAFNFNPSYLGNHFQMGNPVSTGSRNLMSISDEWLRAPSAGRRGAREAFQNDTFVSDTHSVSVDHDMKLSRTHVIRGVAAAVLAGFSRPLRVDARRIREDAADHPPVCSSASDIVVYDTWMRTFCSADPEAMLRALKRRPGGIPRVIFIGEEHSNPFHHKYQLDLIKAIDLLDDAPLMIGLEMCMRKDQRYLDTFVYGKFSAGRGSIYQLEERTMWDQSWGYPIEQYAGILDYAREKELRLIGLNLPFSIVSEVGKTGLASLNNSLGGTLPEVCLDDQEHYQRFVSYLQDLMGEGKLKKIDSTRLQSMYEAQALWDDYMASSLAKYVSTEPVNGAGVFGASNTGRERIVVLAGKAHVEGRVGIPNRFTKRTNLKTFTVVPQAISDKAGTGLAVQRPSPNMRYSQLVPNTEGDWVYYSPYFEEDLDAA